MSMKRGYLFIALATLFFSTMEIALKAVAGQFNPVQLNLTRFLIGGLVLVPFARRMLRKRGVRLDGAALLRFALLAFLGIVVSMTLYQLAVENTNASVVAVLFSCNPVFVLVFAALILHTRIRRRHTMALVLECLGILILINPFHTPIGTAGIVLTLLSTATFALYTVLGTKLCARYSGLVVTCCTFLLASAEMAALVALSRIPAVASGLASRGLGLFADIPLFDGYTPVSFLMMIYICVGVTGAGFAFYFMAMEETSPITASLVFFFKPVLAPLFALIFLREAIPFTMVMGIVLILAGSLVSLIPALPIVSAFMRGRVWSWKRSGVSNSFFRCGIREEGGLPLLMPAGKRGRLSRRHLL